MQQRPDLGLNLDCFLESGWLEHFVDQNKSETTRVSISFNIDLTKKKEG